MRIDIGRINLREQKNLIFIVVVIFITLFFGKKIWDYQKAKSAVLEREIKNYQEKKDLAIQINSLFKEFDKFKDFTWPTKESVSIMGNINDLATNYNIEIFTFDPGELQLKNQYLTLPMSLNIRADYFNLKNFVSAVEELKTLTKVINLKISPDFSVASQENGPVVRAYLNIEAFILME